jgi:hypothetical protein
MSGCRPWPPARHGRDRVVNGKDLTMTRHSRITAIALAASTGTVLSLAGGALSATQAAAPAPVTVTIKAEGTDLSGTVKSPRRVCKANRTVVVIKQVGARGGGNDTRFASDTTELSNGVGQWSTGNTGTEGRFYAKVRRSAQCKGDTSPTIRVTQ